MADLIDVVVVGGGIASGALGTVLARAGRSVADPALALFRAAAFLGPEVVPAEAFTGGIRAHLLEAA